MTEKELNEAVNLFLMQKDKTRLSGVHYKNRQPDNERVILPKENYYEYYSKKQKRLVAQLNGYNDKYDRDTHLEISTDKEHVFGQCVVLKEKLNKDSYPTIFFNVEVATYMEHNGKIVILNRFDHGRFHDNHLSIYSNQNIDEQNLYEKYFKEKAGPLHFHFNTAYQSKVLNTQDCSNAIGMENLIKYLEDLQRCDDKNAPIYKYNLGMPFLDYKKNLFGYNSQIVKNLQAALKNEPNANMIKAMQNIILVSDCLADIRCFVKGADYENMQYGDDNFVGGRKGDKNIRMIARDMILTRDILEN